MASDSIQTVSGMLAGPAMIHLEVAELTGNVVSAVKNLPFVSDVYSEGAKLSIQVASHDDVRAKVSKEVTGAGGVIVGMSQKASTLEDVFIQLIGKDNGGKKQ